MDSIGDFVRAWFDPRYEWLWGVVVPVTIGVVGLTLALLHSAIEWVVKRLRS